MTPSRPSKDGYAIEALSNRSPPLIWSSMALQNTTNSPKVANDSPKVLMWIPFTTYAGAVLIGVPSVFDPATNGSILDLK